MRFTISAGRRMATDPGQRLHPVNSSPPEWVASLRDHGMRPYYASSGHAWVRFHRWAFMRYPPNDTSPVESAEASELFRGAGAPVISHHRYPRGCETPNAILYLCRDREYDISKLSANNRSKVRRGLKRLIVRQVTPFEVARTGYASYADTCKRNGITPISHEAFVAKWQGGERKPSREIWAALAGDEIAALGVVHLCGHWAEIASTSSADAHLHDYPNHALFYTLLRDLMHRDGVESVSYGLSSVQAASNRDTLHHFKLSVNLEAIPVVRSIGVNPILRPVINTGTRAVARALERRFPGAILVRTARGALDLMTEGERIRSSPERSDGIYPIGLEETVAVAELHGRVGFSGDLSSQLGASFCAAMYRAYCRESSGFGFVAWRAGEPVGFVVGCLPASHRLISRALVKRALVAVLRHPAVLMNKSVLRRAAHLVLRRSPLNWRTAQTNPAKSATPSAPGNANIKLVRIGVVESARGSGVSRDLLSAFAQEATRRGYRAATLMVGCRNYRARGAYEKAGWVPAGPDSKADAMEYTIDLPSAL